MVHHRVVALSLVALCAPGCKTLRTEAPPNFSFAEPRSIAFPTYVGAWSQKTVRLVADCAQVKSGCADVGDCKDFMFKPTDGEVRCDCGSDAPADACTACGTSVESADCAGKRGFLIARATSGLVKGDKFDVTVRYVWHPRVLDCTLTVLRITLPTGRCGPGGSFGNEPFFSGTTCSTCSPPSVNVLTMRGSLLVDEPAISFWSAEKAITSVVLPDPDAPVTLPTSLQVRGTRTGPLQVEITEQKWYPAGKAEPMEPEKLGWRITDLVNTRLCENCPGPVRAGLRISRQVLDPPDPTIGDAGGGPIGALELSGKLVSLDAMVAAPADVTVKARLEVSVAGEIDFPEPDGGGAPQR